MKIRRLLVVAIAASMLLVACGDSSGGDSANPVLVAALAAELAGPDDDGEPSPFPLDEAECASEKILSGLGTDRIVELGIEADNLGDVEDFDFTDDELNLLVNSFGDCSDLSQLMAQSLIDDGTFSQEEGDCFADEFDEDLLKDVFKATFQGEELGEDPPESFINAFIDVAAACDIGF